MTPRAVTAVIPQRRHAGVNDQVIAGRATRRRLMGVTHRGKNGRVTDADVIPRIVTPGVNVSGPVTIPAAASQLVLSLFSGIDLLGRAFREAGFSVVSGPDLITGGRIEDFRGLAGRFDGIIAGPPCQDFSCARRGVRPSGYGLHCLRELLRVIDECRPIWWLVENVPAVPDLAIDGYAVQRLDVTDAEFSGRQLRRRHIQFGHRLGWIIRPERLHSRTHPPPVPGGNGQRRRPRHAEFRRALPAPGSRSPGHAAGLVPRRALPGRRQRRPAGHRACPRCGGPRVGPA